MTLYSSSVTCRYAPSNSQAANNSFRAFYTVISVIPSLTACLQGSSTRVLHLYQLQRYRAALLLVAHQF